MKSKKVIIISFIFLQLLTACGGIQKIDRITVKDYFTDELITIPITTQGFPNGELTEIYSDLSIEELCSSVIKESSDEITYTAIEWSNQSVLISVSTKETTSYLLASERISRDDDYKLEHSYVFYNMGIDVYDIQEAIPYKIIWPMHLINDIDLQGYNNRIYLDTEYDTTYSFQDFVGFYEMLNTNYLNEEDHIVIGVDSILISSGFLQDINDTDKSTSNTVLCYKTVDDRKYVYITKTP